MTPEPLVPADVDLRGFSGFMLDVDRLLASELVALGTPEECWAAVMLWCRAWKQTPAGSLPNDDRVLRGFSGAGLRWPKVKAMALRGFVLCSDGRLYHRTLAEQVAVAWKKRAAYQGDQERLRKWREAKRANSHETATETPSETATETRFTDVSGTISERDRQGQGQGQRKKSPQTPRKRGAEDDPAFAAFWAAYPRRDDKGHARTAWKTAVRKATPDAIMAGLARYRFKPEREYQPLPATWLTGERWNDQTGTPLLRAVEPTGANPTGRVPTPMTGGF